MLTGESKKIFIRWSIKEENGYYIKNFDYKNSTADIRYIVCPFFENKPIAEKFGVYQDFADSLGIHVEVNMASLYSYNYSIYMIDEDGLLTVEEDGVLYNKRNEARTKAIKKLNEILNQG